MERRVSARIETELWIGVIGVDPEPRLRRGNFSGTGVYFEVDQPIGAIGSLQCLHLVSYDRSLEARVVARLARRLKIDDVAHRTRPVTGVGMQFLPSSQQERATLVRLLRAVIKHQVARDLDLEIEHGFEASIGDRSGSTVQLSVHRMLLDTSQPLEVGEIVEFDIRPGRGREGVPFVGEVTRVSARAQPDGRDTYRVEVSINDAARPGGGASQRLDDAALSFPDTIDRAFTDLIGAEPDERAPLDDDLMGQLARIPLTTLLQLFDMERMSGALTLRGTLASAVVYLSSGRIIDAVADPQRLDLTPRALLAELARWRDGTFEFALGPIDRPDRFETSTTALLLDLARQQDERERPPDE